MPDQIEQQPSASAIGEQFLANSGRPIPDSTPAQPTVPTPQNAQPAPAPPQAAPSPEQQAAIAQTAKHQMVGRMFQALTQGGSGSSASNLWRSVISGALIGMGAAESAPVVAHGPYGDIVSSSPIGAAGRAFTAVQQDREHQKELQQRQDQIDKQNKQREFENKLQMDDLTLKKAADARAQQSSIQNSVEHEKLMQVHDLAIQNGKFELAQKAAQSAQQQVNFFNALQDVGAQPLQGSDGNPLQFSTHEEAEKAAHDNPKFFIGDFKTRTAYDPTTNKYGIYRVPDTDIKNIQLKDEQGVTHTIPRMSATEYLDYQSRKQNLKKGALEISKIGAEVTRLQNDTKSSGIYGNALKELNGATDKDGNVDLTKVSPGSRAVLYDHSAKGLEDASRAILAAIGKRSAAVISGDKDSIDEANQEISALQPLVKTYSGTLNALHGNPPPNPNQIPPNVKTAVDAISHLPKEQQAGQIDASSKLTPAEKQTAKQALGLK
jgi:hypothetical protein